MKKKKIYITTTTDLPTILSLLEVNDVLEENIQLKNYGDGLKEIVFNAIILSTPSQIHQSSGFFDPKKKSLTGSSIFDYSTLENSDIANGKITIIRGFIKFVETYSSDIQSFDLTRFKNDVLNAFEMKGTTEND